MKTEEHDTPVGFVHFRFELEGEAEVLYVYELQVAKEAARKGLGMRLMQIMELAARKYSMKWVMVRDKSWLLRASTLFLLCYRSCSGFS